MNEIKLTNGKLLTRLEPDLVEFTLKQSNHILEKLNETLELDAATIEPALILIPQWAVSMSGLSHFGSILFDEGSVIAQETSSPKQRELASLTLARYISSQYFGQHVISQAWEDEWLIRGLVSFFEYEINHQVCSHLAHTIIDQSINVNKKYNRLTTLRDMMNCLRSMCCRIFCLSILSIMNHPYQTMMSTE